MTTITLKQCNTENLLTSFLNALDVNDSEILIDFCRVPFLIPVAVLALVMKIREWQKAGKKVSVRNHHNCRYLQRIDFFNIFQLNITEQFVRHEEAGKFIPITAITPKEVDDLSVKVADCLMPEQVDSWEINDTGMYDYIVYAISELANNVIQHSQGKGYCYAQRYTNAGFVRIAIVDNGRGIRKSLEDTPYKQSDDVRSIEESLKVNISGRAYLFPQNSPNAGVGLSLLTEVTKLSGGTYFVISGNGLVSDTASLRLRHYFQGTLCGFKFPISSLNKKSFNIDLLRKAKINLNLLSDNKFEDMFLW